MILGAIFIIASAHDMFMKLDTYFLKPNTQTELFIYNGTFEKSENAIERNRMQDVSLIGPDYKVKPSEGSWYDKDNISILKFKTGESGTYAAGISITPKLIDLTADEFNEYLEHDGVLDVLEERKSNNELNKAAREKYSKHVKAIFQVGEETTDHFNHYFGYPIEFVPQYNPYTIEVNSDLKVKLLLKGKPLKNHLVYVGYKHTISDQDAHEGHHHEEIQLKTNSEGIVNMEISHHGFWYIRTIHMVESSEKEVDYESNWATLTFEHR